MTHTVPLTDGWSAWRWVWLRATGFPARGVLALAAPDAAAAVDRIDALEVALAPMRRVVIDELELLATAAKGTDVRHKVIRKAIAAIARGKLPATAGDLLAAPTMARLCELEAEHARARVDVVPAYADALARSAEALAATARDPRFREALVWQNRHAVEDGIDWLLAHPGVDNSRARQKQHLVANYLQRYSVKNDTIGFFGPIAWAELDPSAAVTANPGATLLSRRRVDYEHWAIDLVADALVQDPELRPYLSPRLASSVAIKGTTLHYGYNRSTEVDPAVAALIAACDGTRSAHALVQALADAETTTAELYELLADLADRKLVLWTLEVSALTEPERELRRMIAAVEMPSIRERALGVLDRLDAARDEVQAAAGDVARLELALAAFDALFTAITGKAATRGDGGTYAARTPLYEDCTRDLSLVLGAPLLDRLGPAFSLIGQSARWFTHELARRYRTILVAKYAELTAQTTGPVGYLPFWRAIQDLFPEDRNLSELAGEVAHEFHARWEKILAVDLAQPRVQLTAAELAPAVAREFAAPAPGWPGARHLAPDILVAATSLEAIARGELTLVMGEVHLGNTLLARLLIPHGPADAEALVRAYDADMGEPRVVPVETRARITRADAIPASGVDFDLEIATSKSWRPRARVLRAADLVVEPAGDSLTVRDAVNGHAFDVIAVLEDYFIFMAINQFKVGPEGPHVPRISIDDVVMCREQWTIQAADLPALDDNRGWQQFASIRTWARQRGLPRHMFAKIPEEPKPIFLDLESPIYVEIFTKMLRKASRVTLSEMLPGIHECWIPDRDGNTYAGELRLIVVDPVPWNRKPT